MTNDFALSALVMLAQYHGIAVSPKDIEHQFDPEKNGISVNAWVLAARQVGLKSRLDNKPISRLPYLTLPLLVWRDDGEHFILAAIDKATNRYLIHDFHEDRPITLSKEEFEERYSSKVISIASRSSVLGKLARFDFSWFIPVVIKYRRIFIEVIVASIALQLLALMTPLFFQVVMDKVLVHRGFSTLNVIVIALVVVVLCEVILGGLRTYIFAHTTSRIDVELGARLFRHMLALPLSYFSMRRVGDTVARVRELEQIRNFLTGQALTSVLDMLFSFIFLAVMWTYSYKLTLVVFLSLPVYIVWSLLISPPLKKRLDTKFARNAENQSFLVETVTAIGTIKAMAVTPQITHKWNKLLASYVSAGFSVTHLATVGQQGIQLIQKAVMTIGQLIAFNMLSGQVTAPVLRLAQLWQDFQQVGISVARLGDILNYPTEVSGNGINLPPLKGDIEFKNISFRYKPEIPRVLENVSFNIAAGEIIGVVGRSGSGKSTLTRLLQRLYVPEQGQILIDGHDISLVNPASLRRQIGVVQQENILLNRCIRENIALACPGIAMERIIAASRLAGAHDFISELPEGYDTVVGEQGSGLSGGQRQRIAIARALITDPRILILDEATSALDYESENAIMRNMHNICKNRTVIIIAHRLSTVRMADRIMVMDKGNVAESGTHQELLARPDGIYHYLHQLQSA
ncbi:type I secretion system permease/ATPase [Escherichia coli]|nr:type I secretion system permease/ATPase [Escherichia coli]EIG2209885.1 type I secretion system permease/ATPase [Escherichia coli]